MSGENVESGAGLSNKMRALADADGLPADHELRIKADAFDTAKEVFYVERDTVTGEQFMERWAAARRAWCNYTGETLI